MERLSESSTHFIRDGKALLKVVTRSLNGVADETLDATGRRLAKAVLGCTVQYFDATKPSQAQAAAKKASATIVNNIILRIDSVQEGHIAGNVQNLHISLYARLYAALLHRLGDSSAGEHSSLLKRALQNCMIDTLIHKCGVVTGSAGRRCPRKLALFIAELFNCGGLPEQIVHHCIRTAVRVGDDVPNRSQRALSTSPTQRSATTQTPPIIRPLSVLFVSYILRFCGKKLDSDKAKCLVNEYFERLALVGKNTRGGLEFLNVKDMRSRGWGARRQGRTPCKDGRFAVIVKSPEEDVPLDSLHDSVVPFVTKLAAASEAITLLDATVYPLHAVLRFSGPTLPHGLDTLRQGAFTLRFMS